MRAAFVFAALVSMAVASLAQQGSPYQRAPFPPAQGQYPAGAAPKTDCAADGTVVNSITGEPIPRAHISSMASQVSAVADNSGRWTIANLTCGRLQLTATRPGFLNGGVREPVSIGSDSPAHGVQIKLTPQSVVVGKVLDESGDPVMNAQITALASRVMEGRRTFQMTSGTQTNDLGEFRIASLPAGKFIFCARGPVQFAGFPNGAASAKGDSTVEGDSCYPGPVEGGAASAMELQAGRETEVDFTLRQVPAVHVRGIVTGMPKNQGAAVTLQPRGPARGPMGARPASIAPDGHFDVRGVTPGSYMLVTDYWDSGSRLTARVPVDVGGADVDDVVVHLEPGVSISGSVRVESVAGKTLPAQPWGINLRSADPTYGGGQLRWNTDRMSFTFTDATPGAYRIEGSPPPPFYIKSAMYGGHDMTRQDVQIAESGGQIDVVLSDDSGSVEGSVEDADGQPARGNVMLLQEGRSPRTLTTGADGHFRMANLAPGDYRIYAWDDITQVEYADADWMQRMGGKGQSVTVDSGQTATVKLSLGQSAPGPQ